MSGSLRVTGTADEAGGSLGIGPFVVQGSVDDATSFQTVALTAGLNTIMVPLGAAGVVLVPESGGPTMAVKTNLNMSDAGLPLAVPDVSDDPVPFLYSLPAGVTSLLVNSGGTGNLTVAFV